MSYNGIGLQTPRGTATSGYVQKNVSSKAKKPGYYQQRKENEKQQVSKGKLLMEKINKQQAKEEIVKHEKLRQIEVKCCELRDDLEDEDVDDKEIDKRVDELRKKLLKELESPRPTVQNKSDSVDKIEAEASRINEDKDQKTEKSASTKRFGYVPRYPSERPDKAT